MERIAVALILTMMACGGENQEPPRAPPPVASTPTSTTATASSDPAPVSAPTPAPAPTASSSPPAAVAAAPQGKCETLDLVGRKCVFSPPSTGKWSGEWEARCTSSACPNDAGPPLGATYSCEMDGGFESCFFPCPNGGRFEKSYPDQRVTAGMLRADCRKDVDTRDGPIREWFKDGGELRVIGQYVNGKRDGRWIIRSKPGVGGEATRETQCQYKNGKGKVINMGGIEALCQN